MNVLTHSPLLAHLGWSLLHFLWQGVLVGLIYFCLRRWLRQAAPQWRYLLAMSTLLVLVVLPVATFCYLANWHAQGITSGSAITVYSIAVWSTNAFASLPATLQDSAPSYLPWVVLVWLIGVVCMMLRAFHGWRQAGRLRLAATSAHTHPWQPLLDALQDKLHMRRAIRLMGSARVHAPLVIGWLKPVILIPPSTVCGLNWQQAEMILAHELAHIRRHDYLFNLLQVAIEILLFYHPVVHWISHDARTEREFCCDDTAMKISGDRVAYLKALAELEQHRLRTSLVMAANGSALWHRAYRLAYRIEPVGGYSAGVTMLVLLASTLATLLLIYPRHALTQAGVVNIANARQLASVARKSEPHHPQLAVTRRLPSSMPTATRITVPELKVRLVHRLTMPTFSEPVGSLVTLAAPRLATAPAITAPLATAITVVAPHPLPQPEYPYQALRDRLGGSVQVSFRLSRRGRATDVQIKILSGPAVLASAVRTALANWQFKPAQVDGKTLTPRIRFAFVFNPDTANKPGGSCSMVIGSHICHRYQISLQNLSPPSITSAVTQPMPPDEDIPVKLAVVEDKQGTICHPQDNCFFTVSQPPPNNEQRIRDQLQMLSQGFIGGGSL